MARRFLKRLMLCAAIVATGLIGWVVIGGAFESTRQADCIVVPGAAVWRDRKPSDALEYRLNRAAELYAKGRAPWVIVTGGGEGDYAEGEVMADWLVERGVPRNAIIVENYSATTRDSGNNVARIMKRLSLQTALVCTQWFHVARTRLCLEQEGVETLPMPCGGNTLMREPWFVLREMGALPIYALRLDELR